MNIQEKVRKNVQQMQAQFEYNKSLTGAERRNAQKQLYNDVARRINGLQTQLKNLEALRAEMFKESKRKAAA